MGLQLRNITRNGEHCLHLVFDCVLDGQPIIVQDEFEKLKTRFDSEPGGYKQLLLLLFALYQVEQGRRVENLHLYIA